MLLKALRMTGGVTRMLLKALRRTGGVTRMLLKALRMMGGDILMYGWNSSMEAGNFSIIDTSLGGVRIISPYYMEDERGYFLKDMERSILEAYGLEADICETFESGSKKDVIRGLHFQLYEPQVKIVRVVHGSIYDVVLDLRKNSATFGEHMGIELNDRNHMSLYIPAGFAHGFRVLSSYAVVAYKCMSAYHKNHDFGIIWNDPDLAIPWEAENPVISERDSKLMSFREFCIIYDGL